MYLNMTVVPSDVNVYIFVHNENQESVAHIFLLMKAGTVVHPYFSDVHTKLGESLWKQFLTCQ